MDVVFGQNRKAGWNKLMVIEHGSAVMPEQGSTIASRRALRADNFEQLAVKAVAPRGSGAAWCRATRERVVHSRE